MLATLLSVLVLLQANPSHCAIFSASSGVEDLTATSFQSKVLEDDGLWIVMFYAPWCGHCKSFGPEYEKAAKALKGTIKFGAVDGDAHDDVLRKYGVKGFPTIKIFGSDKGKPVDYSGDRTASGVVNKLIAHLKTQAEKLLGGGSSSKKESKKEKAHDDSWSASVSLTSDNFDEKLEKSDKPWLVVFHAPWCGHCKALMPEFEDAAVELKGMVNFGKVDATEETSLAGRYEVKGFPTVFFFSEHSGDFGKEEYTGGRTRETIVSWLQEKTGITGKVLETAQITGDSVFQENCMGKKLCMLAFLPTLEDVSEKELSEKLGLYTSAMNKAKSANWGWNWLFGGDNDALEEALHIEEVGYPILVAIHTQLRVFSVMHHPFTVKDILNFSDGLKKSKVIINDLPKTIPAFRETTAWVSKSAKVDL